MELKTYEDVEALFLALGWGCKSCGRLNSAEWHQASGDTYCAGCKRYMKAELPGVQFTEYPRGGQTIQVEYDATSEGFEYAAWSRQEHERIHGFLPSYS